ncbi:MAG: acyl-ACP desaturase [Fimbriimonadaceae bacterium]
MSSGIPPLPPDLELPSVVALSQSQRHRMLEDAIVTLYRWYVARSQELRNWNPDSSINWGMLRQDHTEETNTAIEGFYAVEQYVPDYTSKIVQAVRTSHGRSHFQLRWGSEEQKHMELWRNAIIWGGKRNVEWVRQYGEDLRNEEWRLPWDDPVHMLFYTVFQERATQVNYLNLGLIARGKGFSGEADADPVLEHACKLIAADEAAHYHFFLECARLQLYFFPTKALEALANVLRHFAMPAGDIIPNFAKFSETVMRIGVYGPRNFSRDVAKVALAQLGVESLRKVEEGIRKSRNIPDEEGRIRSGAIFESLNYRLIEQKVRSLFGRLREHNVATGRELVEPLIEPAWTYTPS